MKKWTYYNDVDPFVCEWARNLIKAGLAPPGEVHERPIQEINPEDLTEFVQCHFFSGILGWPLALRMAGFPDDFPVWTGSCPCQPFSQSGVKRGFSDDRHLWPAWFRLIAKRRPPVIMGEQVASPDGLRWFDLVSDDLEGAGYTVRAADLSAAGAGAPHIRQRLYFVAYTHGEGRSLLRSLRISRDGVAPRGDDADGRGEGELADAEVERLDKGRLPEPGTGERSGEVRRRPGSPDAGGARGVGNPDEPGRQERERSSGERPAGEWSPLAPSAHGGAPSGFWGDCDWIPCRDPKRGIVYRPVEPQHVEMVDGLSDSLGSSGPAIIASGPLMVGAFSRVGRLRGYGNAIVPEIAAQFALAVLEAVD